MYSQRKTNPAIALMCVTAFLGIGLGIAWNGKTSPKVRPATEESESFKKYTTNKPRFMRFMANSAPEVAPARPDPVEGILERGASANRDMPTIVVNKNATLCQILSEYVGRCDRQTIREICEINSEINDPNHIEAGQQLMVPLYARRQPTGEGRLTRRDITIRTNIWNTTTDIGCRQRAGDVTNVRQGAKCGKSVMRSDRSTDLPADVGGAACSSTLADGPATCEARDRKGLYAKARAGLVQHVTGISDPYETPRDAELVIDTSFVSPAEAAQQVLMYLHQQGYVMTTGRANVATA